MEELFSSLTPHPESGLANARRQLNEATTTVLHKLHIASSPPSSSGYDSALRSFKESLASFQETAGNVVSPHLSELYAHFKSTVSSVGDKVGDLPSSPQLLEEARAEQELLAERLIMARQSLKAVMSGDAGPVRDAGEQLLASLSSLYTSIENSEWPATSTAYQSMKQGVKSAAAAAAAKMRA